MVETPASDKELRYRNVSIHSQGKTEHGTLYLLKHHAFFSFYPGGKKGDRSTAHSRNASGIHQPVENSTEPTKDSNGSEGTASEPKQVSEPSKVRPKEIWIPYPLIASCVLRPSHAASMAARSSNSEYATQSSQSGEDLFPPTFGTSEYERPSTDSARLAPFSTPPRPSSPAPSAESTPASSSARQPVIRIRRKDFQMMALHFNSGDSDMSLDETARQAFLTLRKRSCIDKIQELHAFHYQQHKDESRASMPYDARKEYARMGISAKAADGPGAAWRITDINHDYSFSKTYPNVLCVPKAVSDNMLKYGGPFRSKSRIPCLTYLHSNGGCITRSSQPFVGVQNKRNPQDERLVQAIFSSHTPPPQSGEPSPPPTLTSPSTSTFETSAAEPSDLDGNDAALPTSQSETALNEKVDEPPVAPRIYGSTRQNVIFDARPRANVFANQVAGGGIEDVANYQGHSHVPVERIFLNIANIHVMQKSLGKVIESLGSADYLNMRPNQETLRKSGWLGHIAGLLEGSELVARVVGLGGSHALVHCSDGWDRTSQVAALAQIMMDPHCRTLNGFISLVQKDFLSFGHKFRDRNGIQGSEDWFSIENERIVPSRTRENNNFDTKGLNAMGQRAFTGAKNWFQKNRGNFLNQRNDGGDGLSDTPGSRSSSPPPTNPIMHSTPSSTSKEDKENQMSLNEVSPVFHQFLDTVYQLLHQEPNAFEYNERLLKRLFYQAYACQYGEFLFNNERDRAQHNLPSVWGHFLLRRQEFTNPDYVPKVEDPLLFPRRKGPEREVEVRWWASLFGRKDEEMNLPRALAPPDPAPHTAPLRPTVSFEESMVSEEGEEAAAAKGDGAIKETRSTPSLASVRDTLTNSFSSMTFRTPETRKESVPELSSVQAETAAVADTPADEKSARGEQEPQSEVSTAADEKTKFDQMDMDEGDPLGVSSSAPKEVGSGRLDFATFASQNAFRDR